MSPAVAREPCRQYGDFVPLAEVPIALVNGWRIIDQLADDPIGARCVLMTPPAHREAA